MCSKPLSSSRDRQLLQRDGYASGHPWTCFRLDARVMYAVELVGRQTRRCRGHVSSRKKAVSPLPFRPPDLGDAGFNRGRKAAQVRTAGHGVWRNFVSTDLFFGDSRDYLFDCFHFLGRGRGLGRGSL